MLKDVDIKSLNYSKCILPCKEYTEIKNIIGLDSETFHGKAFVFTNSNGESVEMTCFEDIFKILHQLDRTKTFYFLYNLEYDKGALLKWLPIEKLKELAESDECEYKNIKIRTIPHKALILIQEGHKYIIYDAWQFYKMSLQTASKKYLNEEKMNIKLSELKSVWQNEPQKIIDYCIQDSKLCAKLMQKIYGAVLQIFKPKYFYSSASFSQQRYLETLKKTLWLPKEEILDYYLKLFAGGRFETMKRGFFSWDNKDTRVYSADIISAYPSMCVNVPDINLGKWKKIEEFVDCDLAVYKCCAKMGEGNISPFRAKKKGVTYYPHGEFKELYLNQREYLISKKYCDSLQVIDGYALYIDDHKYPYTFLKDFFKQRKKEKGMLNYVLKIILNGFYGKSIQVVKAKVKEETDKTKISDIKVMDDGELIEVFTENRAGKLFNPLLACEITCNTRAYLLEKVFDCQESVVSFATDNIKSTKRLCLPYGENMGDFKDETIAGNDYFIVGCGMYSSQHDSTCRGIRKEINFLKDLNDFSVIELDGTEHKIVNDGDSVSVPITHTNGLKEMNRQHKLGAYNEIVVRRKDISLNFDEKRLWERKIVSLEKSMRESPINSVTLEV